MTACAYISPATIPALLADTVLSFEGVPNSNFYRPSSIVLKDVEKIDPVMLARKIHILGHDMAFAFAGKVSSIEEYIRIINKEINKINRSLEHPLKPFRELANHLPEMEVLGCLSGDGRNCLINHENRFHLSHLDLCMTIGSGAAPLSVWLEQWNDSLNNWTKLDPYEVIRGIGQATASKAIAYDADGAYEDWGCFFEYCTFYRFRGKWIFGPANLYFTAPCGEVGFEKFTTGLGGRAIAYFPQDNFALIRSYRFDDNLMEDWIISNFTDSERFMDQSKLNEIWKNFQPFGATISFLPPPGLNLKMITISTDIGEHNEVYFNCSDRELVVGVSDKLWDKNSRIVAKVWGLEYERRI